MKFTLLFAVHIDGIDAKDDNGMTPIDYAAKSSNADVFNFLTEQSVPWY
nr:ankyrin repeat domain-containing protein [Orientia tsutsugamushi]